MGDLSERIRRLEVRQGMRDPDTWPEPLLLPEGLAWNDAADAEPAALNVAGTADSQRKIATPRDTPMQFPTFGEALSYAVEDLQLGVTSISLSGPDQ